ncbi:IEC3 subunit of the Ino80 complex, chromatin re-modelling-domain-containing protein [Lipomyces kononenkoae]|uniref:IEC3 subunit of the Ino80 complex, chromatin re-modelling-domain-containing protein n=1 Tax=Lipomyces kononenkoae TaxID=34357 RepID=A0ACC3T0Q6_LIPKO
MSEPQQIRSSFFPPALASSASTSPPAHDRSPPHGLPTAADRPVMPVMSEMQNISPKSTRPNQSSFTETNRGLASPVPQGLPAIIAGSGIARQPYKSFRKKYRKLRLRFDTVMRENEELEGKDFAAKRTIRRLNAENARLLDMLIDLSESKHISKQFQIGGLGVQETPEETERQAKILKWIAKDDTIPSDGKEMDVYGNLEDQSEIKVEPGNDKGTTDNANTTESGIDGTRLPRPNTPQYLEDEILLLQDDYDSDF